MSGDQNPEQLQTMLESFRNEFEAFNLSGMSPERRARYDVELKRLQIKQAKKALRDLQFEEKQRELQRETLKLTEELRKMHGNLNSIADFAFNSGSPVMAAIGPGITGTASAGTSTTSASYGTANAGPSTATTNPNGTNSYQGQPSQSQVNNEFSVPETDQNGTNNIITIQVECAGKPTLELLVSSSSTVAQLKNVIMERYKLNSNYRMDLYLGNNLLRDIKLLSELDVYDGTVFTCCLSL